ncbi:hypothetical protein LT493_44245 [Streptomyces tricolor]|nr:hypothetical protein [Streptomyces tricolor]
MLVLDPVRGVRRAAPSRRPAGDVVAGADRPARHATGDCGRAVSARHATLDVLSAV